MDRTVPTVRPDWVSDEMYPFESRFFATPSGHRMHFVDEGEGEPIVFVHGNPAWSFEFRHLDRGASIRVPLCRPGPYRLRALVAQRPA